MKAQFCKVNAYPIKAYPIFMICGLITFICLGCGLGGSEDSIEAEESVSTTSALDGGILLSGLNPPNSAAYDDVFFQEYGTNPFIDTEDDNLSTFGMGNFNDILMEQLANNGNGSYAYVDNLNEAKRVFVENLTGTLQIIAKDAKVQVEELVSMLHQSIRLKTTDSIERL